MQIPFDTFININVKELNHHLCVGIILKIVIFDELTNIFFGLDHRIGVASFSGTRRRSARSDSPFVQDKDWQIAQTLQLWVNASPSMDFTSRPDIEPKSRRARLLGLAIAILLVRGGERVGLTDTSVPPRRGEIQAARLAEALAIDGSTNPTPVATQLLMNSAQAKPRSGNQPAPAFWWTMAR